MSKVKLKDVTKLITKGTTPSSVGCQFVQDGINFIKSESIGGAKYLENSIYEHIDEQTDEKLKRSRLQEGDLLFSIAGAYLGKIAIVRDIDLPANTNQAVGIVRLDNEVADVDYVYYYFSQKNVNSYINKLSSQSSQPNLNLDLLGRLELDLPSIRNQRKIADLLEAMAKLIYDYWFVQFDFPISKEQAKAMCKPKLEGKPYKASGGKMVWSEELKREVPEGWEVKELAKVTSFVSRGISPSYLENGGVCVLNQKCIRDKAVNFEPCRRHDNSRKNASAKQVMLYDVLVNSTGVGTLGRVAIFKRMKEEFVTVDSHVTIVRADSSLIDPLYFGFTMLKKQDEIERFSQGSTGQVELSRSQLESLRTVVPSRNLQQAFNSLYAPVLQKLAVLESENEKLTGLRDWLLPMLMNGQVRIKETNQPQDSKTVQSESKQANSYFYQTQLVAAIVNASKKHKITHGEMTLAKYTYLVDKLYGVPTYFNYERLHLGPYPQELKKIVNNKKFFKIQNHEVSVVPQTKEYKYQFQKQVEEAIAELASIFNQYTGKERSHQTELLATVCKVVEDIKSTDFKAVRESMKNWPIVLNTSKFKNKAEKFGEEETKQMVSLMSSKNWIEALISN
jgi:type I restriction enzyme, S subunit